MDSRTHLMTGQCSGHHTILIDLEIELFDSIQRLSSLFLHIEMCLQNGLRLKVRGKIPK